MTIMQSYKYLLFTLLAVFALAACDVEDPYPEVQKAVNMRIVVDPEFSTINRDDPASAKVVLDIFSENVEDVEKVELFADFFDFSEGTTTDRSFLTELDLSRFNEEGVFEGFEISFDDFATALGLDASDFDGLDQVTIYNITTMKDGRVYPSEVPLGDGKTAVNVSPNILNSSATTSFTSTVPVLVQCPLPEGFATGTYMVEQVSGPADPFFGNPYRWTPQEVNVTAAGPVQRTFTGKYLTFDQPFNFTVTCGILVVRRTDTGLSCGGPSLVFTQDGINEYEDDSEFTITLLDNVDGACGLPVGDPIELKLTKL